MGGRGLEGVEAESLIFLQRIMGGGGGGGARVSEFFLLGIQI